jgi:hypothetical protein
MNLLLVMSAQPATVSIGKKELTQEQNISNYPNLDFSPYSRAALDRAAFLLWLKEIGCQLFVDP